MFSLLYLWIHIVSKLHYPKLTFLSLWFATENWVAKVIYRFKKQWFVRWFYDLCVYFYFMKLLKLLIRYTINVFFFVLPLSLFLTLVFARQHNWLKLGRGSKCLRSTVLNINAICKMGNLTELQAISSKWYLVPLACVGDYHLTAAVSVATPQLCG